MRPAGRLIFPTLLSATAALVPAALWMVFRYAPDERVMGPVQRIFYFHVPSAAVTFASVLVLALASVAYLATRRAFFDDVAVAATEIGLVFCTIVLVTGPIWAKSAWGAWWTWEARLTTTLVLWLLLAAILMVRRYAESRDQAARLGAVLGIVAAFDVPIVYKAVDWWRGQHPVVFGAGTEEPLVPEMLQTLLLCLIVFFLLYASLLCLRVRLLRIEERTRDLSESLGER